MSNRSDIPASLLAENLPMFDDAFDITYSDANFNQSTFDKYSAEVFNFSISEV